VSSSGSQATAPSVRSGSGAAAPVANRPASSSCSVSMRAHCGATSSAACCGVRSSAGRSNRRSSTACTSVPRSWSGLGRSGRRSIERKRYSRGQVLKSAARDGDSDGRTGRSVSAGTSSVTCVATSPGGCAGTAAAGGTAGAGKGSTLASTVMAFRLGQRCDETAARACPRGGAGCVRAWSP
jgi:hypothetical protein